MSNKGFYTSIVVGIIILFGIGVYAYGSNNPSVLGHSAGEIEEVDPTVVASVKDGVSWGEVSGRPSVVGKVATGTFTGSGSTQNINVGWQPKVVHILYKGSMTMIIKTDQMPGCWARNSYNAYIDTWVSLTSNGFQICSVYGSSNMVGKSMAWTAWG